MLSMAVSKMLTFSGYRRYFRRTCGREERRDDLSSAWLLSCAGVPGELGAEAVLGDARDMKREGPKGTRAARGQCVHSS